MKNKLTALLALSIYFPSAGAHSLETESVGFLSGLAHPFMGLDHILAMIAVGLWAAQIGGSAVWRLPLSFISMMLLSAVIAASGFNLPSPDLLIAGSVICLGLLVALAIRLPVNLSMLLVGLFAVFHGYAHGLEMPQAHSAVFYGSGFVVATALLQLSGIILGKVSYQQPLLSRLSGAMMAMAGLYLVTAA
jgi:urease accessory protein